MKYKTTKFTIEEKQDILEQYGEWIKPENMVWVEKEYKEKVKQFSYHRTKGYKYIEDYIISKITFWLILPNKWKNVIFGRIEL